MVQLYYEGADLSNMVNVTQCVYRDAAQGRADSLEIAFDHAATWFSWGPKIDDKIRVTLDGIDTGTLYLNTILPENDRFRIIATSLPGSATLKSWFSFENATLEGIMNRCAAECGMTYKLFGVEGDTTYTYLLRQGEGCAALLNRLAQWEGLFIKAYNGAFRAVGMAWAQKQEAVRHLTIMADQEGVQYLRRDNARYATLRIATPYAEAVAKDSAATAEHHLILHSPPARNNVEAGRWARGILAHKNRKAELLTISCALDPSLVALARVNVNGNTGANGAWLVEEVEHDMKNKRTRAKLHPVIETIS